MAEKYYGWLGASGYNGVVKVIDYSEAYVFNKEMGDYRRDDEFMKAAIDPGSDFEEISKEEAEKIIEEMKG